MGVNNGSEKRVSANIKGNVMQPKSDDQTVPIVFLITMLFVVIAAIIVYLRAQ